MDRYSVGESLCESGKSLAHPSVLQSDVQSSIRITTTDNNVATFSFFAGWMPFQSPSYKVYGIYIVDLVVF